MMTAGAQGSGKPTLAVFVVGNMDNALVSPLTTQLGANLTAGGQYALTSVSTSSKLTELQSAYNAGGGSNIDRSALAEWGRTNGVATICLVVDDVKGNDHMFSAQLIDAKDSKLSGKGHYIRTGVGSSELSRVSLVLSRQLEGLGRVARKDVTPQQKWFEPEMVFVEGGTNIQLGSRTVASLPNFRIGKYEVTQEQWRAVMAGTGRENSFYWGGSRGVYQGALNSGNCGSVVGCDDQLPTEYLTWYEAVLFCNTLSTKAGLTPYYNISGTISTADGDCPSCSVTVNTDAKGYRLPTKNQWEYAARGCKAGDCEAFTYSGSNTYEEVAWTSNNSGWTSHKVGQLKPNRLGIYDMSGNVWEWSDDVVTNYTTTHHYIYGGGWGNAISTNMHTVTGIYGEMNNTRNGNCGLRVVLPAQ
jgi:formylglycine-generating enzyme required for sulfatase activity